MGVAVRSGSVWVYFGLLRYPNVRCGTLSTRPLPPSSPSTPATQPQTTPDLTPPGGAGGGGPGGGGTVRFGATKQARFGTVPVRYRYGSVRYCRKVLLKRPCIGDYMGQYYRGY